MAKKTKTKVISPGQIYEKGKKLTGEGIASTKKWYVGRGKPAVIEASKKAAKSYAKYGKPSVTLGKRLLKWGTFGVGAIEVGKAITGKKKKKERV